MYGFTTDKFNSRVFNCDTRTVCVTYTDTHRTLSLFYTRIGNPVLRFIETIRTSSSKSVEYSVNVSKYSTYSVHVIILIYHERDYTGWVNFSTIRSFAHEDKWMSLSYNLKLGLLNHKQYRDPPFPGHLVTMLLVWSRDPSCVIRPPDVRHSAQGWRGVPFLPRFPAPLSPCSNCNSTMTSTTRLPFVWCNVTGVPPIVYPPH